MIVCKHGNTYKAITFKCDLCGCIFQANSTEYKLDAVKAGNDTIMQSAICNCPECKARVQINTFNGDFDVYDDEELDYENWLWERK